MGRTLPTIPEIPKKLHPLRMRSKKLAEAANEINAAAIRLARRWTISMLLERPSLLPNRTQPRQLPREEQDQVLQNDTEGLEQRLHRQQMAKIARIRIIRKILLTPLILRIRSFCTKPSSVVGARVELGVEVVNGRIRPNHGPHSLQHPPGSGPTPGEVCRTSPLELPLVMPTLWRKSPPMRFTTTLLLLQAT